MLHKPYKRSVHIKNATEIMLFSFSKTLSTLSLKKYNDAEYAVCGAALGLVHMCRIQQSCDQQYTSHVISVQSAILPHFRGLRLVLIKGKRVKQVCNHILIKYWLVRRSNKIDFVKQRIEA